MEVWQTLEFIWDSQIEPFIELDMGLDNITVTYKFLFTPAAQCRAGFEPCGERRLAEQKSPVLTAQTTQPA